MHIIEDDLTGPEVADLLSEHMESMLSLSPPESVHALDLQALRAPGVTFWTAWEGAELLGCGALQELDSGHGEIKSMRTARAHQSKGVASAIVDHLLREARRRGYERLSLETGSAAEFASAHRLYQKFGFEFCGPFADYAEDPHSRFMTLVIK